MISQSTPPDLYTAVYEILKEAKSSHTLIKLYKGSHGAADPHQNVLDFASYFARLRHGLVSFACHSVNPEGPWKPSDLDAFDHENQPRIPLRTVFETVRPLLHRIGENPQAALDLLTHRVHHLGSYRGESSGFDEESRSAAACHFRSVGVMIDPKDVLIFCGGAKGVFLAFCATLMCRRKFDQIDHRGGALLAPEGYYQSLHLIPSFFGGEIHLASDLSAEQVRDWLARTSDLPSRAIYVPLVNNATGQVLTSSRAQALATEITRHNQLNPGNPILVLGDDVYADSVLDPALDPMPIGAVSSLADWTVSVTSPSKSFALPTCRVAFAATRSPRLRAELRHYRSVFSHGRAPQSTELTAAAAFALTPVTWTDHWNQRYRDRVTRLRGHLDHVNHDLAANRPHTAALAPVVDMCSPQGGWYVPLTIARAALPIPVASSVEVFAMLLHYSDDADTGLGTLPAELFGFRLTAESPRALLRTTVAVPEPNIDSFAHRLRDAMFALTGPDGVAIARRAVHRARRIADIDNILSHVHY